MNERMSLREWVENYKAGKYNNPDVSTQINAGWYDWFCKDTSLGNKTKKMAPMIIRISESKKINMDIMYVWFKNNCPCGGPLYDDFRIADINTKDVIYNICPKSGHTGKAEVWGRENAFAGPLVEGTMKDIYNFFEV
jgi:hypothetical protein